MIIPPHIHPTFPSTPSPICFNEQSLIPDKSSHSSMFPGVKMLVAEQPKHCILLGIVSVLWCDGFMVIKQCYYHVTFCLLSHCSNSRCDSHLTLCSYSRCDSHLTLCSNSRCDSQNLRLTDILSIKRYCITFTSGCIIYSDITISNARRYWIG